MKYLLTGIDTHPDFGFGITAEAYRESAECLLLNKDKILSLPQREMPINFLYRHSIELYLKSLIIIMHRALNLPYGDEPSESDKPMILVNGQWQILFSCHMIDELYSYWVDQLLNKKASELKEKAMKGDWREYKVVSDLIPLIVKYDRDSSFFRYPVTKKTKQLDKEKHTMKPMSKVALKGMPYTVSVPKERSRKGGVYLVFKDEDNQIVNGFQMDNNVLPEVTAALKKASEYLNGIHVQARCILCDGY